MFTRHFTGIHFRNDILWKYDQYYGLYYDISDSIISTQNKNER
jgi:hypothetical protein